MGHNPLYIFIQLTFLPGHIWRNFGMQVDLSQADLNDRSIWCLSVLRLHSVLFLPVQDIRLKGNSCMSLLLVPEDLYRPSPTLASFSAF